MAEDIIFSSLIALGVGVGSIIIWEVVKFILPPKFHLPFKIYKQKFHLRNTNYPTSILKSYKVLNKLLEREDYISALRERLDFSFKDFKLDYMESEEERLSFQIVKEELHCKFYIKIDWEEDDVSLLLKLNSSIPFKKLTDGLDILFWCITDFYESVSDYIALDSNEIKIRINIKEMNLISELFTESASQVIVSKDIALMKEKDHTKLILSGRRGPELANRIRNIIILGSLQ